MPAPRTHRSLRLTRLGLWAERITRAFWPAWTALFAGLALWASNLVPPLWEWSALAAAGIATLVLLLLGLRAFRRPTAAEVRDRVDATLPGRPFAALEDDQAVGAGDAAARAVWDAHRRRMAERAAGARPVAPDLRVSDRDPYALRYVALLLLAIALPFGTLIRAPAAPAIPGLAPALATGPAWEGWLEPPRHTGLPTLYLNEIDPGPLDVPEGTTVTLRLYGEVGALSVAETVSGRTVTDPTEPMQEFAVTRSGTLSIDGAEGAPVWSLTAIPDEPPFIRLEGEPSFAFPDLAVIPWAAGDDHAVAGARARIALDLASVERRHGLAAEPDGIAPLDLDLPLPIAGDRDAIMGELREALTEHPLAGLPVTIALTATDAAGQEGVTVERATLPARAFYDTTAAALVEMRRDLLWSRANRARAAQVLRAVTWQADDAFAGAPSAFLIARMAIRRLEAEADLSVATRDAVAEMLWSAAIRLEDGSLDGARERLEQARERLSEAIRNGASPEEIARLTEELREAMDEYTRMLAERGQQEEGQQQAGGGDMQEVTPDMLDELMARIEELMAQGRTAEAQELLRQLEEMMENMQVAQGQGGGGQPQPGQQAMDDLRDTLREQQDLSDDAFRELQEQFDPEAGREDQQDGEQQGGDQQGGQLPGQQDGQQQGGGEGQQPQGQRPGQGQPGQQPGQGQEPGDRPGGGAGERPDTSAEGLARRQAELRRQLGQLEGQVPGGAAGDEARKALDRAGRAMDEAERDLAQGDLGGALDDQAEAMDALRDGMQAMGRALAGDDRPAEGNRGQANAQPGDGFRRDPLGRDAGQSGPLGTDERYLDGPDAARRAQDLLKELRRRSGQRERPEVELDYIERLLDRF